MQRDQIIVRTSVIGILANVFLAAFKAVVGVVSLVMNMTVSMWIVRRMNISKGLAGSLALSGLAIIAMIVYAVEAVKMIRNNGKE